MRETLSMLGYREDSATGCNDAKLQTIRREDWAHDVTQNPQRLHATPCYKQVMIQSDLAGDRKRSAEMTDPS